MFRFRAVPLIAVSLTWALLPPATCSADFLLEKEFRFDPGALLQLETDSGRVSVVGSSRDSIEIVVTSRRSDIADRFDFSFEPDDGGLVVKVEKSGRWFDSWRSSDGGMSFEVRIPRRAQVTVKTAGGRVELETVDGPVELRTSGGDIRVGEVDGNVRVNTSGGGIEVESVTGNLHARTSGGPISVRGVDGEVSAQTSGGGISMTGIGGDIDAGTSGGGIEISDAGGRVDADTSGGSVRVAFRSGNADGGKLSSSGGRVIAAIDPAVSLDIDASTSGGSVRSEVPVTIRGKVSRSALRGTLNAGGALLKMRSSGGGVVLEER